KTTIATGLTPFGRGPRLSVCRARLDHPVVRLADHLRHLVTSVAEGVHLLDKSDERPVGHLPPDAGHKLLVIDDKGPLSSQRLGDPHLFHLPVSSLYRIGIYLHHARQLPLRGDSIARAQLAPGDRPLKLIDNLLIDRAVLIQSELHGFLVLRTQSRRPFSSRLVTPRHTDAPHDPSVPGMVDITSALFL